MTRMEKESKQFNIESTPTFIINNEHKITGAVSFKDFEDKTSNFCEITKFLIIYKGIRN